jgi:hypothetical protein
LAEIKRKKAPTRHDAPTYFFNVESNVARLFTVTVFDVLPVAVTLFFVWKALPFPLPRWMLGIPLVLAAGLIFQSITRLVNVRRASRIVYGASLICLTLATFAGLYIVDPTCFRAMSLKKARLEGANLASLDLRRANLTEANLKEADLTNAVLEGAILDHAYLYKAKLPRVRLQGASLIETDLRGTNLDLADLSNADLRIADLTTSSLRQANLDRAVLENTNLHDANFCGARNVNCANLERALNWRFIKGLTELRCNGSGDESVQSRC